MTTSSKTVFLLQESKGLNFAPALEWGTLVTLFPPGDIGNIDPMKVMSTLLKELSDFQPDDYIILSGDPELCSLTLLALKKLGTVQMVNLLKFDKHTYSYKLRRHAL